MDNILVGAVCPVEPVVCPVVVKIKYYAKLHTKYATIEQYFSSKEEAYNFLEVSKKNFEVLTYSIGPVNV